MFKFGLILEQDSWCGRLLSGWLVGCRNLAWLFS